MQHPSEYKPQTLGAFHIMVVDPGTVVKDEASGREETVTDGSAVFKGNLIYCTPFLEAGIKRAIEQQ